MKEKTEDSSIETKSKEEKRSRNMEKELSIEAIEDESH